MSLIYLANLEQKPEGERRDRFRTLHFPTGLGIISGVLSTTDHELRVVDNYISDRKMEDILQELKDAQPDYILFTGFLGNYQYGFFKTISHKLRELCPNVVLVAGGPMATTVPELLITHSAVDYLVIGEGEETILDLLDAIESGRQPSEVKGIAYRGENGQAILTSERPRMKDITGFPFPKYELFNMETYIEYLKDTGRCWEISTSRGCFASCKYCKLTFGRKITFRPVAHIIEEMRLIKERYGIDRFNFVDDNFLINEKRIEEFVDGLRACDESFRFRFQGRADLITRRLACMLREVGCFDISFGLESGSQKMLDYMGKILDVKKAEKNLIEVLDEGIDIHATFIVGMPIEDEETIGETKAYIERIGLPQVSVGILTPFPATEVYRLAKEKGLVVDDDEYCEGLGVVYEDVYVNLTEYSDEQLCRWRDEINSIAPVQESNYFSQEEAFEASKES